MGDIERKSAQSCEGVDNSLWNMSQATFDHCFKGTDKDVLIPRLGVNPLNPEIKTSPNDAMTQLYMQTKEAVPLVFAAADKKDIDSFVKSGRDNPTVKRESGVYVSDDGLMVTAHHLVADGRKNLAIFDAEGHRHNAKVVLDSPKDDLALIKVEKSSPNEKFHSLQIGSSKSLSQGDEVLSVGHALGEPPAFIEVGKVVGPIVENKIPYLDKAKASPQTNAERNMLEIDALIAPGNSGGAWVKMGADKKAMLVAINDLSNPASSVHRAYAVPVETVSELVKKYEKSK